MADESIRDLERRLAAARQRSGYRPDPAPIVRALIHVGRRIEALPARYSRWVGLPGHLSGGEHDPTTGHQALWRQWRSLYREWLRRTNNRDWWWSFTNPGDVDCSDDPEVKGDPHRCRPKYDTDSKRASRCRTHRTIVRMAAWSPGLSRADHALLKHLEWINNSRLLRRLRGRAHRDVRSA